MRMEVDMSDMVTVAVWSCWLHCWPEQQRRQHEPELTGNKVHFNETFKSKFFLPSVTKTGVVFMDKDH